MQNYGIFGTCPSGQLEGRHIKSYGVSVTPYPSDWGFAVGIKKESMTEVNLVDGKDTLPVGISAPSVCRSFENRNLIVLMNVFLSRNRQAVAVQTNDTTVTLGDPVFVGTDGMLTTTTATGWKMGSVASPIEQLYIDINGNVGKNGFLLELCDVVWIGG